MNYAYIDIAPSVYLQQLINWGIEWMTPEEAATLKNIPYEGLIISCEMRKEITGNRSELAGIALAQALRRNGYKGGILLVSFLSRQQVLQLKPEYTLINTTGHGFIQLPKNPTQWISTLQAIRPLNDLEWYDISKNYCNRLGIIRMELHSLFGLIHDVKTTKAVICQKLIAVLKQVETFFHEPVDHLLDKISASMEKSSKEKVTALVSEINNCCQEIIDRAANAGSVNETIQHHWSAIFLDDEIGSEHQLIQLLKKRGVSVNCFSKADDALCYLRAQQRSGNLPALVISDDRLEEEVNGIRLHQPTQGYVFLKQIAAMDHHISLVAFSAMPRAFLLESFRHYDICVDIFSKKDYLESQHSLHLLVDELIRKGDLAYQTRIRLPRMSSPNWAFFESFYLSHQQSKDYQANENYIALKAKSYCEEYIRGHHLFDLTGYTTKLAGKNKTPDQPKAFNDFLEKMICRRAVLWFTQRNPHKIYSPDEVLPFLKGRQFEGDESSSTAKNQVNTNLALRLTEFPWNATVEERNWLIHDMGLPHQPIERVESEEHQILQHVTPQIQKKLSMEMPFPPNTFLRCKVWLSRARNKSLTQTDRKHLQSLVSQLESYIWRQTKDETKTIDLDHLFSRSVKDFVGYLERTRRFLHRIEKTTLVQTEKNDLNSQSRSIIQYARRIFTGQPELLDALESLAFLFLHEQQQVGHTFSDQGVRNKAFVSYCKKEGEYIDPYMIRPLSSKKAFVYNSFEE